MRFSKFLLFMVVGVSVFFVGCNEKSAKKDQSSVKMIFTIGDVQIKNNGSWNDAVEQMSLVQGDEIKTGENSECSFVVGAGSNVAIKQNTRFLISSVFKDKSGSETNVFSIEEGKAVINPKKLLKGDSFNVKTPTAVAGVRGTKFIIATSKKGKLRVAVVEGKVSLKRRIPALEQTDKSIVENSKTLSSLNKKMESESITIAANQSASIDNKKAAKENEIIAKAIEKKVEAIEKTKDKQIDSKNEVEIQEEDELAEALSSLDVVKKREDKDVEAAEIVLSEAVTAEDVEDIRKLENIVVKEKLRVKNQQTNIEVEKKVLSKFVISSNKNSLIYIDSKIVGKGKASIEFENNKKVEIKILTRGFEDYRTDVTLVAGKKNNFEPKLVKKGILKIVTPIKKSKIYVNSRYMGKGVVTIQPGANKLLKVEVKANGFKTYSRELTLKLGESKKIDIALIGKPLDRIKWKKRYGNAKSANPVYYKNKLYVATENGKVTATDLRGNKIWSKVLNGSVESTPFISANRLYIVTKNGNFYSLKTNSGKVVWNKKVYGSLLFGAMPVIANGNIVIATSFGRVYSFTKSGKENWNIDIENGIYSTPAFKKNLIFVGAEDHNLYAIDAKKGKVEWKFQLDGRIVSSSPVVSGNSLMLGCYSGSFYSIDINKGEKLWNFKTGDSIFSTPSIKNNRVFVGSNDGYIYSFNISTGKKLWSYKTGNKNLSTPIAAGKKIFVSSGKKVYALSQVTGKKIWAYDFNSTVKFSPRVVGNNVFVGLASGEVVSVRDSLKNIYK